MRDPLPSSRSGNTANATILIDALPSYRRVVLLRDGQLDQIWIDDAADLMPRPGAVLAARVAQIFPQHDRVHFEIETANNHNSRKSQRVTASARVTANQAKQLQPGQMAAVVVSAMPREDKPLQVKIKGDLSPKDLPSQPSLISQAPDALAIAKKQAPDAEVITDHSGENWAEYLVNDQLEQALNARIELPNGAVLHFNTPPGAAVIDLDSGMSGLNAYDLACQTIPMVMRQIRLRRIAGPIVIDIPRLNADQQQQLHNLIKTEAKKDAEKLALHGFTKGGLYTMARPWRQKTLSEDLAIGPAAMARTALRHIRRHYALSKQGGIAIRLHPDAIAWLNTTGADALTALTADLAFSPEFRSDEKSYDAEVEETAK